MWKCIYIFLLFKLSFAILTNETVHQRHPLIENNFKCDVRPREGITWENFMYKAYTVTANFERSLGPHIKHTIKSSNISEPCSKSLYMYLDGVKKWVPWAIHMADATGRVPSGLLTGTRMSFGSFEQCLKIRANLPNGSQSFKGQFCMLGLESPLLVPLSTIQLGGKSYTEAFGYPPDWISDIFEEEQSLLMEKAGLWVGLCLPSTCTEQDVIDFFTTVSEPWANVSVTDCQTDEPRQWTTAQTVSLYILLIILVIIIISTGLDLLMESAAEQYSLPLKVLLCFSLWKNAKEAFEIKEKDRTPFDFLYGIRFFLSIIMIMLHILVLLDRWKHMRYTNTFDSKNFVSPWLAHLENGSIYAENFFLMSGLLLGLTLAKQIAKTGKVDIKDFLIQRYFRMFPLLMFVLLLLFLSPTLRSGPIWNSTWSMEIEKCQQSWWTAFFLVQNFFQFDHMCLIHTWFLACLMQVQIVGLIIILIALRNQKAGVIAAFLVTASCTYQVYDVVISHSYPLFHLTKIKSLKTVKDILHDTYFTPFCHIPPTLIGIGLAAVIIFHSHRKFSKRFYVIGWISAIIVSQAVIFGIYVPNLDPRHVALYYAFKSIFWSLSFAWTIFACYNGYGGLFSKFMSLDVFIILNRISYGIYIIHPLVHYFLVASYRNRIHVSTTEFAYQVCAYLSISIILSVILHITIENPFINIYYLVFKKKTDSTSSNHVDKILRQKNIDASVKEKLKFS